MKASRNYPFDSKVLETLFVDPKEISFISPLSGGYFNPKLFEGFYKSFFNESWLFYDEALNLIGHAGLVQEDGEKPFLCHLYLVPELRGKGQAQRFVLFLEQKLIDEGKLQLWLNVEISNIRAQKFYRKLNYQVIEETKSRITFRKILL